MVASILSVYDVVKAKDEDGNEVEVSGEYTETANKCVHPLRLCALSSYIRIDNYTGTVIRLHTNAA